MRHGIGLPVASARTVISTGLVSACPRAMFTTPSAATSIRLDVNRLLAIVHLPSTRRSTGSVKPRVPGGNLFGGIGRAKPRARMGQGKKCLIEADFLCLLGRYVLAEAWLDDEK